MKKIGLCVLSLMLIFALVSTGGAQGVRLGSDPDSAKEIVISGEIGLCAAHLNSGITSIMDGFAKTTTETRKHEKSAFMVVPLVTLNFDIDVGEKVTALVQLENTPLDGNFGTAAYVDVLGGDNTEMEVEQAYIKVSEFLLPELTFQYGIQDLKFTLRKGEGAFFMDVAGSENTFFPTVSQPEAFAWDWVPADPATGAANPEPDPLLRDTTEFGGLKLDYGNLEKNNYVVSLFCGTVEETGVADADEAVKGLQLKYNLPGEDNILKVILANITKSDQRMNFWTLGAGAVYQAMPQQLEVYVEAYLQTGDYAKRGGISDTPLLPDDDMDQDAQAFRLGGRYNVEHEMKPYVDVSYWSLSGDEGNDGDTVVGGLIEAEDNEDFISYENVQSTLILEGNLLGLDLDSNYTAIKVEAGITTQVDINKDGTGEEVAVKLLVGIFELFEKPHQAIYSPTGKIKEDLGTEIDLVATLKYTESLSFSLGYGMVTGADYFESVKNTTMGFHMDDADMTLIMFDTRLKF